jgi:2-oxoglutarate ferredoxin oxidoreductase subunit alpha
MSVDVSVKIGGEAGQGIQSVGNLIAQLCRNSGFYIMAINDFESRIRGGHSFFQIRISDRPVQAPDSRLDLLIGLNRETFDRHRHELKDKGLAMIEGETARRDKNFIEVPFNKLAEQFGRAIYSNTVAAASCLCLLGAPLDTVKTVLLRQFKKKLPEVIENNLKAAELGYEGVAGVNFSLRPLANPSTPKGSIMEGAKALARGAGFVAQGFSGNIPHLSGLIQQAMQHKGFSLIDIMQPCVSFNKTNPDAVQALIDQNG